jgi:hypothetical protein
MKTSAFMHEEETWKICVLHYIRVLDFLTTWLSDLFRTSQKFFSAACGSKFFSMFGEKAGTSAFSPNIERNTCEQPLAAMP